MKSDRRLGEADDALNRIEIAVKAGFGAASALLSGGHSPCRRRLG